MYAKAARAENPQDDMRSALKQKARDLFEMCDKEHKGFASKRDMYRLLNELPLSPEQLDEVFDALDKDGNECLTLDEFTEGLGMFLGLDCQLFEDESVKLSAEATQKQMEEEDEKFEDFLDNLGAHNVFRDEDYIKQMWDKVNKDDPTMLQNLENFLGRVTQELKTTKNDYSSLETTLKERSNVHDELVQALYNEMEEQLQAEKEIILAQERSKEQKLRDELETELNLKDHQLQDLLTKHAEMENRLHELNAGDSEKKSRNVKLEKERDDLEIRLSASDKVLKDMQTHLDLLRKKSLEERRKRAQAALKVSEGIALERENLALELQKLKEANKQLLDERDELVLSANVLPTIITNHDLNSKKCSSDDQQHENASQPPISEECGDTHRCRTFFKEEACGHPLAKPQPLSDDECEVDDNFFNDNPHFLGLSQSDERLSLQNNLNVFPPQKVDNVDAANTRSNIRDESERKPISPHLPPKQRNVKSNPRTSGRHSTSPTRPNFTDGTEVEDSLVPERLFKVVFIGDSGVGKSSIIHRFCHNSFKASFSATIGVDFQVKTLILCGKIIALQLWDTAGQERFRSMTNQYFRKADGIVVVYDVTCETSFRNVRKWIADVQEAVDENAVLMLLGNKIDMCESEDDRVVKAKHGSRLSEEFGALFFETSAKEGSSVKDALESFSSFLQEKEDEGIEKVLELQQVLAKRRKKICCTLN